MSTIKNDKATTTDDRMVMRSRGQQDRSRQRVQTLLKAAGEIIAETGFDGLKMRELARRADLPIASVYHYFPSNQAVVGALAIKHLDELRTFIQSRLQAAYPANESVVGGAERMSAVVGEIVGDAARFLLKSPVTAAIWDALKANPDLRALDLEDSARTAREIEVYVRALVPTASDERVSDLALVINEAIQSNLLLIMHAPRKRRAQMIATLQQFVVATIRGLSIVDDLPPVLVRTVIRARG